MKCFVCNGFRLTRGPQEAIEQGVMMTYTTCSFCNGRGTLDNEQIEAIKQAIASHESKTETLRRSALAKLTPEEREALGW